MQPYISPRGGGVDRAALMHALMMLLDICSDPHMACVQDMMQLTPLTCSKADMGRTILSAGLCFDFHKVRHTMLPCLHVKQ